MKVFYTKGEGQRWNPLEVDMTEEQCLKNLNNRRRWVDADFSLNKGGSVYKQPMVLVPWGVGGSLILVYAVLFPSDTVFDSHFRRGVDKRPRSIRGIETGYYKRVCEWKKEGRLE